MNIYRGTNFRHDWLKDSSTVITTDLLPLSALVSSFSSGFPPLGPKQIRSHSVKFRSQTQELEHISFSSSAAQGLELTHWSSWGHKPMSDQWEPGKWTDLIGQAWVLCPHPGTGEQGQPCLNCIDQESGKRWFPSRPVTNNVNQRRGKGGWA